eukprot:254045-Amphidinium_carterae.2
MASGCAVVLSTHCSQGCIVFVFVMLVHEIVVPAALVAPGLAPVLLLSSNVVHPARIISCFISSVCLLIMNCMNRCRCGGCCGCSSARRVVVSYHRDSLVWVVVLTCRNDAEGVEVL